MKILIVWSGALVPAYRQFFLELARFMRVRALGPSRWTHGSADMAASPPGGRLPPGSRDRGTDVPPSPACEFVPAAFWPRNSSRYLVPSLPLHVFLYRPRYVYLMEEMDRPAFLWHALLAKLAWPPVRIVGYSLQNLPRPAYRRWHHALAERLNFLLVKKAIAASREAADVLAGHGWRGPTGTVPLWGSEALFSPAAPGEAARDRRALGIPEDAIVLVFAGSLVEAKGLLLLKETLPRFPRLRLLAAGRGPLESVLRDALGSQFIHLGVLEGEALARCYRAGDYVILPSLTTAAWKEQIGRSLIEGVMCGCIALGSDSGFIPEITLFAETTFRQGDAESLSALLARLPVADSDRIREAQRGNVMERFSAAAAARRTRDALAEVAP